MFRGLAGHRRADVWALAVVAALALVAACTSRDPTYCDDVVQCGSAAEWCNLETKTCEPKVDAAVDAGQQEDGQTDAPLATDADCESPQHKCGGHCYALDDPGHCGASCLECTMPANGSATCDGTSCDFECDGGYWKNTSTCDPCNSIDHCGSGCTPCSPPSNAEATCDGTACDFTCNSAYWRNGNQCDPCSDADHCGPSCVACGGQNPVCEGGQSGRCVCNSTSCSGGMPVCDSDTGHCRGCAEHSECANGVCDTTGACALWSEIIYVGTTGCSDSGQGYLGQPFCTLSKALTEAKSGTRRKIVIGPGTFALNAAAVIDTIDLLIVGVSADQTKITQSASGTPFFQVSQTARIRLSGVGLYGATGAAGDGIDCSSATAGRATVEVDLCTITGNGGSGIDASHCNVTVTRSTIDNNGARGILATDSIVVMRRTRVTRNPAGGLHHSAVSADVENCLFAKNGSSAVNDIAGGVRLTCTGTCRFVHNTVADNVGGGNLVSAGVQCDYGSIQVKNSILWGNSIAQQSGCTVRYSDVEGGVSGTGNINANPLFVTPASLDYHIPVVPTVSPCKEGGDPSVGVSIDLDGYVRSDNPDMGCFEAH